MVTIVSTDPLVDSLAPIPKNSGPWNAVLEAFTTAEQGRQGDVRGVPPGRVQSGRVNEIRSELSTAEQKEEKSWPAAVASNC